MRLSRLIPMLPRAQPGRQRAVLREAGLPGRAAPRRSGWAMLRFDDCRLMLDQSINTHPHAPRQGVLYLYPDDIAAYHEQVRRNGLEIPDLDTTFYGMTEFRLDDPDGNRLWIGQAPAS